MQKLKQYRFHGDATRRPKDPHPDAPQVPEPYITPPALVEAVNLAIALDRPLLLEGEAGCGKTRLARAIAYELGLPFYPWYVRSTSKARDGLYSYDAILRLHDVHLAKLNAELGTVSPDAPGDIQKRDPREATDYRTFQAIGKAFRLQDRPAVVLIDEIDKADVDFPNDLLTVLDYPYAFDIPETGEHIQAQEGNSPIVLVTSNKEKGNLPAPFLRRCVYYCLEFPRDPETLLNIVDIHFRGQTRRPDKPLAMAAINRFNHLRESGGLYKQPGTSELLDWLNALSSFGPKPYSAGLLESETVLPYPELLFKLRPDWQRHTAAAQVGSGGVGIA